MIRILAVFLALCISGMAARLLGQETAEGVYEAALLKKEAEGDLQGAIQLFQKILKTFPSKREVAAKAQFQIGICYEKLGTAEAVKAYELVLKNYADQPELVAAARERLAALRQGTPTETVVQKVALPESWELGALSPDGSKIAGIDFTIGQNIAVYDLENKKKTLVTQFRWAGENAAFTWYPVWRPDGKEIAYEQSYSKTSKDEIWASPLEGKARLLYQAEEGELVPMDWLPDGSAILTGLFIKGKPSQLGFVPSNGGSFEPFDQVPPDFRSADVSPDGRYIVLDGGPDRKTHDIVVISVDSRTKSVLAEHPADDSSPRWSPDGKHVVFLSKRHGSWALWGTAVDRGQAVGLPFMVKDGMDNVDLSNWTAAGLIYLKYINIWDIYTMPVNPLTGEPVGQPELLRYARTGVNRGPGWSHDGKSLAFAAYSQENPSQGRIVVLSAEGGEAREFPIPSDEFNVLSFFGVRWCPDDSGIGFSGVDRQNRQVMFHLILKTGEWKAYPIDEEFSRVEWGKDGKSFYFASWGPGDRKPGIVEYDMETGRERYVYQPEETANQWFGYRCLKASRDYKWLGFNETPSEGDYHIVILDLESGKTWRAGPQLSGLTWSPDRKIMMAMDSIGRYDTEIPQGAVLYLMRGEGGAKKKIDLAKVVSRGEIMSADWSPDGKKIVFDVYFQVFESNLMKNVIPKEGK
jgi:Tol biopolymer transport system component